MLRESRAGHLVVPLLPESFWDFMNLCPIGNCGTPFFSTSAMNETFSVKRLPGSRTIRDLMITSGRGHFKDSIGLLDVYVRKGTLMESDVMDAEGSLNQKSCDFCAIEESDER